MTATHKVKPESALHYLLTNLHTSLLLACGICLFVPLCIQAQSEITIEFEAVVAASENRSTEVFEELEVGEKVYGTLRYDARAAKSHLGQHRSTFTIPAHEASLTLVVRKQELRAPDESGENLVPFFAALNTMSATGTSPDDVSLSFNGFTRYYENAESLLDIKLEFSGWELTQKPPLDRLPHELRLEDWRNAVVSVMHSEYDYAATDLRARITSLNIIQTEQVKLSGSVFKDLNNNCSPDETDRPYSRELIVFNPGGFSVMTDAQGLYTTALPPGDYSVSLLDQAVWKPACLEADAHISISADGTNELNADIALKSDAAQMDAELKITAGNLFPGKATNHIIELHNTGNINFTGSVQLRYPAIVSDLESTPAADVTTDFTEYSETQWFVTDLPVNQSQIFHVDLQIPFSGVTNGDRFCSSVEVQFDSRPTAPQNDKHVRNICNNIRLNNAPAQMQVFSGERNADGPIDITDTKLRYVIHFRNTGEEAVQDIQIRSFLSNQLDITSLKLGPSQYDVDFSLSPFGSMTWNLNGINLPPQSVDPKGYSASVSFEVNLAEGLELGTQIINSADITFAPQDTSRTNIVISEITDIPSSVNSAEEQRKFSVRPNPAAEQVTIDFDNVDAVNNNSGPVSLTLRNILGQTVLTQRLDSPQPTTIDVSSLPVGLYFLRLESRSGRGFETVNIVR